MPIVIRHDDLRLMARLAKGKADYTAAQDQYERDFANAQLQQRYELAQQELAQRGFERQQQAYLTALNQRRQYEQHQQNYEQSERHHADTVAGRDADRRLREQGQRQRAAQHQGGRQQGDLRLKETYEGLEKSAGEAVKAADAAQKALDSYQQDVAEKKIKRDEARERELIAAKDARMQEAVKAKNDRDAAGGAYLQSINGQQGVGGAAQQRLPAGTYTQPINNPSTGAVDTSMGGWLGPTPPQQQQAANDFEMLPSGLLRKRSDRTIWQYRDGELVELKERRPVATDQRAAARDAAYRSSSIEAPKMQPPPTAERTIDPNDPRAVYGRAQMYKSYDEASGRREHELRDLPEQEVTHAIWQREQAGADMQVYQEQWKNLQQRAQVAAALNRIPGAMMPWPEDGPGAQVTPREAIKRIQEQGGALQLQMQNAQQRFTDGQAVVDRESEAGRAERQNERQMLEKGRLAAAQSYAKMQAEGKQPKGETPDFDRWVAYFVSQSKQRFNDPGQAKAWVAQQLQLMGVDPAVIAKRL